MFPIFTKNYKIKSIYTDGRKKLRTRIKKLLSLFCHKTKRSQNSDLINSTINWTNINQRHFFLSCSSRTLFAPQHNMYFYPTLYHNSNLEWIVQLCYVLVRNISKWIRKTKTSHVSFIMEHVNKMTIKAISSRPRMIFSTPSAHKTCSKRTRRAKLYKKAFQNMDYHYCIEYGCC